MLSAAIALIPILLVAAALIDLWDFAHRRRRRHWTAIDGDRRDLERDMASTQHRGIGVPIDDICRDRQRGR